SLIVFTADGLVHGLNHQGIEMAHWNWPYPLDGVPTVTKPSDQGAVEAFQENVTAFLVATSEKQLKQLVITDNQPATMWSLDELGTIQAVGWDDLDKDGRPDTGAFGSREGEVWLYEQLQSRNPRLILQLPLANSTFDLALLKRTSRQSPDLLT